MAAAFDIVLHKGTIGTLANMLVAAAAAVVLWFADSSHCLLPAGEVYNIGGGPEMPNVEVARKLLKIFKRDDQEDEFIKYVVDRPFNDLRYVVTPLCHHPACLATLTSHPHTGVVLSGTC